MQRVVDGLLLPLAGDSAAIALDSPQWFAWLDAPTTRSFAFGGERGTMTVRKDARQRGGAYWVAYRKAAGKLHNVYLGKSSELTAARLEEVAAVLAAKTGHAAAAPAAAAGPGDQRGPQPPPGPLDTLIRTKLQAPPLVSALVLRQRLLDRLQLLAERPLGVVIAPAGFGKTTLLKSWLYRNSPGHEGRAMRVAWLALDEQDNDPARFWTYVIAALRDVYQDIGADALYLLRTGAPALGQVVAMLANYLASSAGLTHTVLVLDDYHLIAANEIHQALGQFLVALPPHVHLLITSRHDPPLPLARLRARGQLLELRAADLRFTAAEAARFLNECMSLQLSAADSAALEQRTEGWIAGLQMAALSLQDRADRAAFIRGLSGSHRYVLDYLLEEVLKEQPATVQRFLLGTAILDRLAAPLCAAVLEALPAGDGSGPGAMLEQLEQRNLFLTPLDDERQWYRYHQLFADVLRVRLKETYPAALPQLHRNAAIWYEQQPATTATLEEALQHWLAAGAASDHERAALIVEGMGAVLWARGENGTLLRWLNRLPESLIWQRPWLAVWQAQVLQTDSRLEQVPALLNAAEQRAGEDERLRGWVAAIRSHLARNQEDFAGAIALATAALALLPASDRRGRLNAYWGLALAQHMSGELDPALASYRATAGLADPADDPYLEGICRCLQAHVLYEQGRLRAAGEPIRALAARASALPGAATAPPVAGWALVEMGRVALAHNDPLRAAALLESGLALAQRGAVRDAICMGYSTLVPVYQALGDYGRAIAVAEQFTQLAQATAYPLYLAWAAAVAARLQLGAGDLAAATGWANSYTPRPDALFYADKLAFATFVRVRMAEGRYQEALELIGQQLSLADQLGHGMTAIELRALTALCERSAGRGGEALSALDLALGMAAPETILRPFLDGGRVMAALLAASATGRSRSDPLYPFLMQLLNAFPEQERTGVALPLATAVAASEPLTPREEEILRLIAQGYPTPEIAARLVVSAGTVKTHLHHLYGKLEARDRAHALVRARELGLLP